MVGAFDSIIPAKFHENFKCAVAAATEEAVMTGGIVQMVSSIRVERDHVWFFGEAPKLLLMSRLPLDIDPDSNYFEIKVEQNGTFNTDWATTQATPPFLGALVFHGCDEVIRQASNSSSTEPDGKNLLVGIRTQRVGHSFLANTTIGARLCKGCGVPIDERRRLALPKTVYCVECQEKQERRSYGYFRSGLRQSECQRT